MLLANSVAPDQTARMRRLIWGYTGRKCDKGPFLIKRLILYVYVELMPCDKWTFSLTKK